jgi:OOP family OmpA-OmpF porin
MKPVVMAMFSVLAVISLNLNAAQKKIIVPKDMPSIQKALDEASEGDTVYVLSGTYKESIVMKDYIALVGQNVDNTIIRGNGRKPVVEGANHTVIKNFTIEHGSVGIICKNTNPVIEHTIIRNNRTGIHCLISLPDIRNTIVCGNEWTGIYCELITSLQRTSIDHDFIADNGYSGITLANKSEVLIQNTILFNNRQFGIYVNEDSKRSRIVYNNFFGNRTPYNIYAVINETNVGKDPGLNVMGVVPFTFASFGGPAFPLAGLGKGGSDIGPMSDAARAGARVDSDNDGIPDDVDQCKDMPEDKDGFQDEDGCPDFDNDNDGIYDSQDKCPSEAEDFDGFEDSDGCPDLDNDKDGIPDKLDKCPNTPEDMDGYQDEDGCPDGGGPGKASPAGAAPAKGASAQPKATAAPQQPFSPAPAAKPAEVKQPASPAAPVSPAAASPAKSAAPKKDTTKTGKTPVKK